MKKILTVSLVAIMAVSAARADIASVRYVDDLVDPVAAAVETKADSAEVEALKTRVGTAETNITDLTTTVSEMDAAYKLADQTLTGKIAAIEAVSGTVDSTVSQGSTNPVSSGAVYTALQDKQGNLSEAQMAAVNSTITVEKVAAYDDYATTIGENTAAINAKVAQTEFDQFKLDNTAAINAKVAQTEFDQFKLDNTAAINAKVAQTEFDQFKTDNTAAINAKVAQTEFEQFKTDNTAAINAKANADAVYTKAEADALLDEKQNVFENVEQCTQNGAYDCAAVANRDGSFGWQRIVYTSADKTTTPSN